MIETDCKTYYYTKSNLQMTQLLEDITFATDMNYIKWEKKYDAILNSHFYVAIDDEYRESYTLYYEPSTIGCVLQVYSSKDGIKHEIDDRVYEQELKTLRGKIMKKFKKNKAKKKFNFYDTYKKDNKYTTVYTTNTKLTKQEKAKKQLAEVDSMRNSERL